MMVLDNLIRGLHEEDIKVKVLAMDEADCTLDKIIRFVEADELGCRSVVDTKTLSEVSGGLRSAYKRQ